MRKSLMQLGALALVLLGAATPAMAQEEAAEPAGPLPEMPADSMEIGNQYMTWLLDYDAEPLLEKFSDEMKERFGPVGDFIDRMGGLFDQLGSQERVISQQYWIRNGKRQFWHTAKFSAIDEPVVFRFVIEPDGTITGIGINPQSQNPPVDDPHQHDADS